MSTVSRTQGAPSVTGNFRFGSIHVHHLPVPGEGPVVSVSSASGPSSESIPEKPVMTVGVSRVEEVEQRFFRSKLPETWTVEDQLNLSRFNQSLKKLTSSSCGLCQEQTSRESIAKSFLDRFKAGVQQKYPGLEIKTNLEHEFSRHIFQPRMEFESSNALMNCDKGHIQRAPSILRWGYTENGPRSYADIVSDGKHFCEKCRSLEKMTVLSNYKFDESAPPETNSVEDVSSKNSEAHAVASSLFRPLSYLTSWWAGNHLTLI